MGSSKFALSALFISILFTASACDSSSNESAGNLVGIGLNDISGNGSGNGSGNNSPPRSYSTQVLLFNGTGISTSDWQSVEQILKSNNFTYKLVNSAAMDAMSEAEIATYGTMVFPGGYSSTITSGLAGQTRINIRNAVINDGVGYVGFCAGAGTAVSPAPASGQAPSFGFSLINGSILNEYLPNGQEPTAAMVPVTFANGSTRELIWVGGPITPSWDHGVIAKYETGDAAISQAFAGKGLVEITGPHPEAPASWVVGYGLTDSDGVDHAVAIDLFNAAISGQPLPTF